jgi:hypothetical protein
MSAAPDDVTGWFDAILTTKQFAEHVIGQFPNYKMAKATAKRIMRMEHDYHPYALRVLIKPSKVKMYFPEPLNKG